jgi:hypothetical protein
MNENKLQQLFTAARRETTPPPAGDFADAVLRAIRRAPVERHPDAFSLFDPLNRWGLRLAFASVAVIVLCASADLVMGAAGQPETDDTAAQVSTQYLMSVEDM